MRTLKIGTCTQCGETYKRKSIPLRGFCGRVCYHESRKGCGVKPQRMAVLPVSILRECFTVDLDTGIIRRVERPRHHFLTDRAWRISKFKTGSVALTGSGPYLAVSAKYQGHIYKMMAHRVVWALAYGQWPTLIDHIDGDGRNNKISNLRAASPQQNMANRRGWGSSGRKGVRKLANGAFSSAIKVSGKTLHLGTYDTEDEASAAYASAARAHFGDFASW